MGRTTKRVEEQLRDLRAHMYNCNRGLLERIACLGERIEKLEQGGGERRGVAAASSKRADLVGEGAVLWVGSKEIAEAGIEQADNTGKPTSSPSVTCSEAELRARLTRLRAERKDLQAEVEKLRWERDELRDEVERLKKEGHKKKEIAEETAWARAEGLERENERLKRHLKAARISTDWWKKKSDEFREEVGDWRSSARAAADEKCTADQKHCTCVGLLRKSLEDAKRDNERLKRERDELCADKK